MNRFLEFLQNHPYLFTAAFAVAIAAIVMELRHRKGTSAAVGPLDAVRLINSGALVLDVRPAEAFAGGHIIDARHIAAEDLGKEAESLKKKYLEKPVILCCDSGMTSAGAANTLKAQGFSKVVNLRGGLQAWKQENLPLVIAQPDKVSGKGSGKGKSSK
ncbi:MAG TPA: rhodanese-like domain-containing protein [Steroidobacteraceae bacterium]|nr:rhodanese-like domain-containing protein [Steroidobacteraceae bacterium]